MLTGRRLTPLPVTAGTWSIKVNGDDALGATVPARAIDTKRLQVWESTTLGRVGLLAVEDGIPVAAGPLWKRRYTQGKTITLTAGGMRSYLARRVAIDWIGNAAQMRSSSLVWPDGTVFSGFDLNYSGLSLGTIAKRLVQAALEWPGGNVPITLPPDEAGTNERNYAAIDLKMIGKLLDDLTAVINGPDISFRPYFADDGLGIYWQMSVGTTAKPRLGNDDASLVKWTVGAPTGGAFDLEVDEDGTGLAEEVFATAGNSSDKSLFSRWNYTPLAAAGFPLLQAVDHGHSDIEDRTLLSGYTREAARLAQFPRSFWTMSSRKKAAGAPELGDYWLGDMATITVAPEEPVLPPGDFIRRIASIGSAVGQGHYDLTFAEAIG
jgi:hypothetical protein